MTSGIPETVAELKLRHTYLTHGTVLSSPSHTLPYLYMTPIFKKELPTKGGKRKPRRKWLVPSLRKIGMVENTSCV